MSVTLDSGFPLTNNQVDSASRTLSITGVTTPGTNRLLVVAVAADVISGANAFPATVSGGGLTWTLQQSNLPIDFANLYGTQIWTAPCPSVITGQTISFAMPAGTGGDSTSIAMSLRCYADSSGNMPAVGVKGGTSNTSSGPLNVTLNIGNGSWIAGAIIRGDSGAGFTAETGTVFDLSLTSGPDIDSHAVGGFGPSSSSGNQIWGSQSPNGTDVTSAVSVIEIAVPSSGLQVDEDLQVTPRIIAGQYAPRLSLPDIEEEFPTGLTGVVMDPGFPVNSTINNSAPGTITTTVSTAGPNRMIVVAIAMTNSVPSAASTTATISDTAGLSWTQQVFEQQPGAISTSRSTAVIYIWTAIAAAQLSGDVITVQAAGYANIDIAMSSYGFAGMATAIPVALGAVSGASQIGYNQVMPSVARGSWLVGAFADGDSANTVSLSTPQTGTTYDANIPIASGSSGCIAVAHYGPNASSGSTITIGDNGSSGTDLATAVGAIEIRSAISFMAQDEGELTLASRPPPTPQIYVRATTPPDKEDPPANKLYGLNDQPMYEAVQKQILPTFLIQRVDPRYLLAPQTMDVEDINAGLSAVDDASIQGGLRPPPVIAPPLFPLPPDLDTEEGMPVVAAGFQPDDDLSSIPPPMASAMLPPSTQASDDEIPAADLYGQAEEESWSPGAGPPPVPLVYRRDSPSDLEEVNAASLQVLPDEDEFTSAGFPPPVQQVFIRAAPVDEEDPPAGALQVLPDEDEWAQGSGPPPVPQSYLRQAPADLEDPPAADLQVNPDDDPRPLSFLATASGAIIRTAPPDEEELPGGLNLPMWEEDSIRIQVSPPTPATFTRAAPPDEEEIPAASLAGVTEDPAGQAPPPGPVVVFRTQFPAEDEIPFLFGPSDGDTWAQGAGPKPVALTFARMAPADLEEAPTGALSATEEDAVQFGTPPPRPQVYRFVPPGDTEEPVATLYGAQDDAGTPATTTAPVVYARTLPGQAAPPEEGAAGVVLDEASAVAATTAAVNYQLVRVNEDDPVLGTPPAFEADAGTAPIVAPQVYKLVYSPSFADQENIPEPIDFKGGITVILDLISQLQMTVTTTDEIIVIVDIESKLN